MSTEQITRPAAVHPEYLLQPSWAEITAVNPEVEGIATYWFKFTEPSLQRSYAFRPGQFNMIYVPGVGEAAISICSDPEDTSGVGHSIRFVGNVTRAVSRLKVGDVVGLRGPFGTSWPMEELIGKDLFIATGGIGLPPLRPAIYHIIHNRDKFGKVTLLYGARTPDQLMYTDEHDYVAESRH